MLVHLALIAASSSCYGFHASSRRPAVAFRRAKNSASLALAPEQLNDIYIHSHLMMDSQAAVFTYLGDDAQAALFLDAGGE